PSFPCPEKAIAEDLLAQPALAAKARYLYSLSVGRVPAQPAPQIPALNTNSASLDVRRSASSAAERQATARSHRPAWARSAAPQSGPLAEPVSAPPASKTYPMRSRSLFFGVRQPCCRFYS